MALQKQVSILGCGWLGLPLARHFVSSGWAVKGSTTSVEKLDVLKKAGILPSIIELNDYANWPAEFFRADTLIINVPPSKAGNETYVRHTEMITRAALHNGTRHIIFVSSTSVYPEHADLLNEEFAVPPGKHQGHILSEAEKTVQLNFPQTGIVRFGGLLGPGRHPGQFFAGRSGLKGAKTPVNFIAIEDCIGIIDLMARNRQSGIYNGVCPHHPLKQEFYTAAAKSVDMLLPVFDPLQDLDGYKLVSGEKVSRQLGYSYKVTDLFAYLNEIA